MDYAPVFVTALGTTALVVAMARLLLSFILSEPTNFVPALCVGAGFLIGHYSVNGSPDDPEITRGIVEFAGSAACLIVFAAGFWFRAKRTNVN